ncbi:hypothetical protein [Cytobacillus firmus]|uniref:hypothetical protein n=1 Tax=Cytobacillus firmus TaxID=1399 RepID=UPI00300395FA
MNKVYNEMGIPMEASKMEWAFLFWKLYRTCTEMYQVLKDDVRFFNEGESQHDSLNAPSELEV